MDNSMESMLDIYLFESTGLLDQLDELLLNAEKQEYFTEDEISEIFRIMHTIKGSSAMMQFGSLMTIAHRIEDLFFIIREKGIDDNFKMDLFDLMFKSTDYLKDEVEKLQNGEDLLENVDVFTNEVDNFLNKMNGVEATDSATAEAPAAEAPKAAAAATTSEPSDDYTVKIVFDDGCGMENLRSFMLVNSISDVCEDIKFHPDDVETNAGTCSYIVENGFLISFKSEDDYMQAVPIIEGALNINSFELLSENMSVDVDLTPPPAPVEAPKVEIAKAEAPKEEPKVVETPAPEAPKPAPKPAPKQGNAGNAPAKQSLISVNLSKLDSLMDIVGEIVITESMVTSSPDLAGLKLDNFIKSARQLRKLTDELQDIAMSIRMVPVSGVFQKMNRIVRDMGQKLNKDVRLTIIGEDTEVDKTIVDTIGDPIMHSVRNSMDHAIETNVKDRLRLGKSAQAEIKLTAQHTGSEVIISIEDDGRGMDPDGIMKKAKENGILTKPENEYTKKEILALLMAPGFSTKEQVTEFSGRGVGMDVVKKNIEKIGGVVSISSELGKGSCVTYKIPLTLAIVDGMEIAVGKSIFTIPITNIRQSFKITEAEVIHDTKHGEMVERMGGFYPIVRVHEVYSIETEKVNIEDGILIWAEASDKSYCLFVDELLGEQQVVVKPIPAYLDSFNVKSTGMAGCTILGDGNISLILDVLSLYDATISIY